MTLHIRAATGEDEAATVALWRTCGLTVSHNEPATDFHFARAKENSDVLVGTDDDGRLIAGVMVGHDGHRGWLYYLAVDPAYRAQGLGRAMVRGAEKWLMAQGVVKVQLMVRETNTKAVAFYERIGFEVAPRTVMQKWLKPPSAN